MHIQNLCKLIVMVVLYNGSLYNIHHHMLPVSAERTSTLQPGTPWVIMILEPTPTYRPTNRGRQGTEAAHGAHAGIGLEEILVRSA